MESPDNPHADALAEGLRTVEVQLRAMLAGGIAPYDAGWNVWSTAMSLVSPGDRIMRRLWLIWGGLTDRVECAPQGERGTEARERADADMRRAASGWLAAGTDLEAREAWFDHWMYEELRMPRPPKLSGQSVRIRLGKRKDGTVVLRCERPDGTVTSKEHEAEHAAHAGMRDLLHYAVEDALDLRQGCYSLIAAGWDFNDFDAPWPRGPLPVEAEIAEAVVGLVASDLVSGGCGTSATWRAALATHFTGRDIPNLPTFPGWSTLILVTRARELHERFLALPADGEIELSFELLATEQQEGPAPRGGEA